MFDLVKQIKIHCVNVEKQIQLELNLSEAEFTALRLLESNEILLNREFAEKMNLSVSRSSRVVTQLYKKGFLKIAPIPDNRRCLAISLTKAGISIKKEISNSISRCEEASLSHLNRKDRQAVYTNLENTVSLLTPMHR